MTNGWIEIRERLSDAFSNVPRPDLDAIPIIGCCERHEQDFAWYRRHTWQEFELARETRGFDPADFAAIHPVAFHYFTPGVLRTAIKRLVTDADKYWDDELWIHHYIIDPYGDGGFKEQCLPLYEIKQRQAVADTLRWYQQWFLRKMATTTMRRMILKKVAPQYLRQSGLSGKAKSNEP